MTPLPYVTQLSKGIGIFKLRHKTVRFYSDFTYFATKLQRIKRKIFSEEEWVKRLKCIVMPLIFLKERGLSFLDSSAFVV